MTLPGSHTGQKSVAHFPLVTGLSVYHPPVTGIPSGNISLIESPGAQIGTHWRDTLDYDMHLTHDEANNINLYSSLAFLVGLCYSTWVSTCIFWPIRAEE